MINEIERKFLPNKIPSLNDLLGIAEERFYLPSENGTELRVQKKGDKYSMVKKFLISEFERKNEYEEIAKQEYLELKSKAKDIIKRTSYSYSKSPKIDIKVYSERYDGLVRIEIEFDNTKQMEEFIAPDWFGKEITGTKLARDSELIGLSEDEYKELFSVNA